jgi:hypothetical protein
MAFWNLFKKAEAEEPKLTPEYIESLPAADDATFYRDSKRLLQRFDEYITSAEAESETLSIELDGCLEQQESIEEQLRELNKPDSWHERHLLLKLDRFHLHSTNLMQRVEIYSQNIKIYLNLISKIQDVKAMRMNGLDPDKISTIWVEFRETLENYRDRVMTEAAGFHSEAVTTRQLEDRLHELEESIFPDRAEEPKEAEKEAEEKSKVVTITPTASRKSIEDLMEEQEDFEDLEDDYYEEPERMLE